MWKLVTIAGMNSSSRVMTRSSPAATDSARAYISRYEVDRRSIFVGNLPLGTTEQQIKDLFEPYGKIEEINLRENASKIDRKPASNLSKTFLTMQTAQEKLCFAFVQFEHVIAVSEILSVPVSSNFDRSVLTNSVRVASSSVVRLFASPRRIPRTVVVRDALLASLLQHQLSNLRCTNHLLMAQPSNKPPPCRR